MQKSSSRRIRAGDDAEIDAYALEDGRVFLFCHVKDGPLAGDVAFARRVAEEFSGGPVLAVGRAAKTETGSTPLETVWLGAESDRPPHVVALEGELRFVLETSGVLNPGLFLDQRENRERLGALVRAASTHPSGDGFLNLFSYTGAFSVAARRAGVQRTTSVDVSARYLAWEGRNFETNFGAAAEKPRLIRDDARDVLRRAVKRGAKYRFVVLDPPTFSRADGRPFKVRESFGDMARYATRCLVPDGPAGILVSTNDARWGADEFTSEVTAVAVSAGLRVEPGRTPPDFGAAHPLKSAWLLRD